VSFNNNFSKFLGFARTALLSLEFDTDTDILKSDTPLDGSFSRFFFWFFSMDTSIVLDRTLLVPVDKRLAPRRTVFLFSSSTENS
jgi:hypothetical protein